MNAIAESMDVRNLIRPDFLTLSTDTPAGHARELMLQGALRYCLVLDGFDVYGVVTAHDLMCARSPEAPVSEVTHAVSAPLMPDSPVKLAIECMAAAGVSAIPVVASGLVVGLVSMTDCMRAMAMLISRFG
jgi:CBS domain-containing protein